MRTSSLTMTTTVVLSDDQIVRRAEGQGRQAYWHTGWTSPLQLGEAVAARVPIRLVVDERNTLGNIAQIAT